MKAMVRGLFRWLDRLRRIMVNGLFIIVLLMLAGLFFAERPQVPEHAVLVLNPKGAIVEELALPSPSALSMSIATPNQTLLRDLTGAITQAAADDRIQMMVLKLDEMEKTSLPKLQAIGRAIATFKASGKTVVAVGPNYSQSQYYLAAAADRVFLDPLGMIGLEGFSIYKNYFKDGLDKLHIDVQLFRAGKYKAAIEPLIRNDMSPEDRLSNRALLQVLWSTYKNDVAGMRQIRAERLQALLDRPSHYLAEYDGSSAQLAKAEGLVDVLADHGAIEDYIATAMGASPGAYASIDVQHYLSAAGHGGAPVSSNRVGMITASGMILDGKQPPGSVGSQSMIEMLEQARLSPQVRAVVIRIDSPGGSAQASEAIRSAILRLKQSGKPVVVSMGSMAASGGYWMAAPADQIWAAATTVTGSIGAFGVMPNMTRSLDALGVHSDGVGTTAIAGGFRPDRQMPAELQRVMELSMQHIYGRFLQVVADGRQLPLDKVAGIAEGRVWSGLDAQRLGLVDQLGSLDDAVNAAAKLAGIEADYSRLQITQQLGLREMLLVELFGQADTLIGHIAASFSTQLSGLDSLLSAVLMHEIGGFASMLQAGRPAILTICDVRPE